MTFYMATFEQNWNFLEDEILLNTVGSQTAQRYYLAPIYQIFGIHTFAEIIQSKQEVIKMLGLKRWDPLRKVTASHSWRGIIYLLCTRYLGTEVRWSQHILFCSRTQQGIGIKFYLKDNSSGLTTLRNGAWNDDKLKTFIFDINFSKDPSFTNFLWVPSVALMYLLKNHQLILNPYHWPFTSWMDALSNNPTPKISLKWLELGQYSKFLNVKCGLRYSNVPSTNH